jgi:hypothetical protein
MEDKNLLLWQNSEVHILPKKITNFDQVVNYGIQLSVKDKNQIISAFENGSYEMVSTFIWTKTITSLKNQLSKMGVSFIAELLDRPDINEHTNLHQAISEYEAIRLAEELGIISGTAAFRLRQAMETVTHFTQSDLEEDSENDMTEEEAKTIVRSCVQGILAFKRIEIPIDFKNFRRDLEATTLSEDNPQVTKLLTSPYFFHRATLRILLSIIKTATGAQLENTITNSILIIPKIWTTLMHPEKYQVGRSYSELYMDGQTKAANGLKQILLKVKGFDFVPEDLRSSSFIKAANEVLVAHEGRNNFYNEPGPMNTLFRMGSIIPIPAFSICMTAILSVKLGNSYGYSGDAQPSARAMLKNISQERWVYFFNECLPTNDRILYKLAQFNPAERWIDLFSDDFFDSVISDLKVKSMITLLTFTKDKRIDKVSKFANDLYTKLGYTNK